MKKSALAPLVVILLALVLTTRGSLSSTALSSPTLEPTTQQAANATVIRASSRPTETLVSPATTARPPTPGSLQSGRIIVVNSAADSGPGTLRQAILDAQRGDIITFDPAVFPPTAPVTISLSSSLPAIRQGYLTIDGSNAGVVLDGSNLQAGLPGLEIQSSNWNVIRGLRFENFLPGAGIALSGGAQHNTIGGDRSIGAGPLGQGNQVVLSGAGIGLWGKNTSFNTVTGNVLGTDASGTAALGNNNGIGVSEGGSHNILGPDNIIAFNRENGIGALHPGSIGNTILHNSIHDNKWLGIDLEEGGNAELTAPLIFDFDLYNGTIAGTTCSGCVVEVFSDRGDEGETYEGQATADSSGAFVLDKGTAFAGPYLTTTATDPNGNTSEFSEPTTGTVKTSTLQVGNLLPRFRTQTRRSDELADNRIGNMIGLEDLLFNESPENLVDRNSGNGFKWVRLSFDTFDWSDVAKGMGGYSTMTISPDEDRAITLFAENGIKMMYCMVYWDEELGIPEAGHPRFASQEEIDRYLDFVRFLVRNLKDRVEYFEIFNEPNYGESGSSQQNIRVSDYIELVRQTVPVIHAEYPQVKIVVGATSLSDESWRPYLFAILESDIMPLVDAVAFHPGARYTPAYPDTRDYYYTYPSIVQQIKDTSTAHGFTGEYILDELGFGYPDNPSCDPCYPWTHSNMEAAKYMARAIVMHLGIEITVGIADDMSRVPQNQVVRNLSTIMAGARPISLTVEIQSEATNILHYSFSLDDGDRLFALWTDGVAVEDDPGVTTTLILHDFSDQWVTGIDVLHGFQQQMTTDMEDGNLVIRNLLVKDYPIILRLAPTRYVFLPVVLKSYAQ